MQKGRRRGISVTTGLGDTGKNLSPKSGLIRKESLNGSATGLSTKKTLAHRLDKNVDV